jgi:hypothetical protein
MIVRKSGHWDRKRATANVRRRLRFRDPPATVAND